MNWYLMVLKKYTDFNGRSRRKEYWMFTLINVIIGYACMGIDYAAGITIDPLPYGYLYIAYMLITFIPTLAVAVRRLHDVEKSGWFLLIGLIPLIGAIWLLILFCKEGTLGSNEYGVNPKNPTDELNEIGVADA